MLPQQREALLVLASSVVFTAALALLQPWAGGLHIEATFGALGAFVIVLWIGRSLVGLRAKSLDERDVAIRYRAGIVAMFGFGSTLIIGAILLCTAHRETGLVPVAQVALLAYGSWMAMYLLWSVTVLVLYRRGA